MVASLVDTKNSYLIIVGIHAEHIPQQLCVPSEQMQFLGHLGFLTQLQEFHCNQSEFLPVPELMIGKNNIYYT